ncbi:Uncharacterized protein HZ326_28420, partial [Fusarium oxysporum f. sp. albedinis]
AYPKESFVIWSRPHVSREMKFPWCRLQFSSQHVFVYTKGIGDKLLYGAVRKADEVICRRIDCRNERMKLWPRTAVVREITDSHELNKCLQRCFVIDGMSQSFFSFCQLLCSMHTAGLGESILNQTVTPFFNRMFMGFQLNAVYLEQMIPKGR